MPYYPPYMPGRYDDRGGSSIRDLIMDIGRTRAQGAARSGEIWGNAMSQIGQIASGAIGQYQMAKRDAAAVSFIDSWDGQDQKGLLAGLSKILGPDKGPEMARTVISVAGKPEKDPEKELAALRQNMGVLLGQSDDVAALGYQPMMRRHSAALAQVGVTPEMQAKAQQWNPETREATKRIWLALGGKEQAKPADIKLGKGDILVSGEDPSQVLARGVMEEPKPEKGPAVGSFEDFVVRKYGQAPTPGQVTAARSEWSEAGRDPERQADPATRSQNAQFLLQGGTADKIPIGERAAAVADAKASGGIDGTGFVPTSGQQQVRFSDFMDLRGKATRLRELIQDPEVASKLGPAAGRVVGATKELPLIGQSTKVKEAFDLFKDLSDAELRKRSGAAISPGEYARITGFTVDPTKQPDSNLTNVNRMLESIERTLKIVGAASLPGAAKAVDPKSEAERLRKLYGSQ